MATTEKAATAEKTAAKVAGQDSRNLVLQHAANELIFAVVGHVGSGTSTVAHVLAELLESPSLPGGKYDVQTISARERIEEWATENGLHSIPILDARFRILFLSKLSEVMPTSNPY